MVLRGIKLQRSFQAQRIRSAPCPGVFSYEEGEESDDRWYGEITLKINETVEGATIRITLEKPAQLLVSWAGEVFSTDNLVFIGYHADAVLYAGTTYTLRIMVKFDKSKSMPLLKSIHFNSRQICPKEAVVQLANIPTTKPDIPGSEPTDYISDIDKKTTTSRTTTKPRPGTNGVTQSGRPNQNPSGTNANNFGHGSSNNNLNQGSSGSNSNTFSNGGSNSNNFDKNTPRPSNTVHQGTGNSNSNNGAGNNNRNPGTGGSNPNNFNNGGSSSNNFAQSTSKPSNNNYQGNENTNHGSSGTFSGSNGGSSGERESQVSCGTVALATPLITAGQKTHHGQWPWHVALYKTEGINLNYMCGGSLISKNKVITAAHCLVMSPGNKILSYKSLVVYLGKYNLRQYAGETGVQTKEVSRLNVNPTYNSSNYNGDIAILTLSTDVEYTNYVRPVCVWEETDGIDDIEGKEGTVAGWGLTEAEQTSEELKMAVLPVVSTETCLRSYPKFYAEYLSERAFCAGFRNGTGPCNGDSGGGLVFKRNNNTWFLRGLVSISVAKDGLNFCDTNYYVIFTDVARYTDFIRKNTS